MLADILHEKETLYICIMLVIWASIWTWCIWGIFGESGWGYMKIYEQCYQQFYMEYAWCFDRKYDWGWDREYWKYDQLYENDMLIEETTYRKKKSILKDYWEEIKRLGTLVKKLLKPVLGILKLRKRLVRYLKGEKKRKRYTRAQRKRWLKKEGRYLR